MRRARLGLFEHAQNFLQFPHQRRLVLQPAGRVDDDDVGAAVLRRHDSVEGEAGGIGAGRARYHLGAGALAPNLELLDRRGAEGVAGGEHDFLAAIAVELGELADRRGLAAAVDTDHQKHEGLMRRVDRERLLGRLQGVDDALGQGRADFLAADLLVEARAFQLLGDLLREAETEIGTDQQLFELVERRLIEFAS